MRVGFASSAGVGERLDGLFRNTATLVQECRLVEGHWPVGRLPVTWIAWFLREMHMTSMCPEYIAGMRVFGCPANRFSGLQESFAIPWRVMALAH